MRMMGNMQTCCLRTVTLFTKIMRRFVALSLGIQIHSEESKSGQMTTYIKHHSLTIPGEVIRAKWHGWYAGHRRAEISSSIPLSWRFELPDRLLLLQLPLGKQLSHFQTETVSFFLGNMQHQMHKMDGFSHGASVNTMTSSPWLLFIYLFY